MSFNYNIAKQVIASQQFQTLLRTARTEKVVLQKAFQIMAAQQHRIQYNIIAMKVELPSDINKGEVQLQIELGDIFTGVKKSYEIAYSRRMKAFAFDEESPALL